MAGTSPTVRESSFAILGALLTVGLVLRRKQMSNTAKIKFGTDGWRAVIADEYTFANVERVAQAYADYLTATMKDALLKQLVDVGQLSKGEANSAPFTNVVAEAASASSQLVIVGYDRRFLSESFAQRAAEVLAGNNFTVALFDEAMPTPLISWAVKNLTRRRRCHHRFTQSGRLQRLQDQSAVGRQCGAGNNRRC